MAAVRVDGLGAETADTVRRRAHMDPELDLWLSRRNRMNPGDRLWFFFTSPESEVAAVADDVDVPYEADPEDPRFAHGVEAIPLPEPTDALYGSPVGRSELELGQVRSVQKVKPGALQVLLARAGL